MKLTIRMDLNFQSYDDNVDEIGCALNKMATSIGFERRLVGDRGEIFDSTGRSVIRWEVREHLEAEVERLTDEIDTRRVELADWVDKYRGLEAEVERLTAELATEKIHAVEATDVIIEAQAREKALREQVERLTAELATVTAVNEDFIRLIAKVTAREAAAQAREKALREQVERLTALGDAMCDAVRRAWIFAPESLEMDEACEVWEMKGDKNE